MTHPSIHPSHFFPWRRKPEDGWMHCRSSVPWNNADYVWIASAMQRRNLKGNGGKCSSHCCRRFLEGRWKQWRCDERLHAQRLKSLCFERCGVCLGLSPRGGVWLVLGWAVSALGSASWKKGENFKEQKRRGKAMFRFEISRDLTLLLVER